MNKLIALCFLAVLSSGCGVTAVSESSTNNPNLKVQFLFENDGCRIYRFYDEGYPVYYTKCGGVSSGEASWSQPRMVGKVITRRPVEVSTSGN